MEGAISLVRLFASECYRPFSKSYSGPGLRLFRDVEIVQRYFENALFRPLHKAIYAKRLAQSALRKAFCAKRPCAKRLLLTKLGRRRFLLPPKLGCVIYPANPSSSLKAHHLKRLRPTAGPVKAVVSVVSGFELDLCIKRPKADSRKRFVIIP